VAVYSGVTKEVTASLLVHKAKPKLSEEEHEFIIKGNVFNIRGNPLSNSIVVLADYDKMSKIGNKVQKLSSSTPSFKQKTTTSPDTAEYKFKFKAKVSKDNLPKMAVISLLWYGNNNFAVTSADDIGGRLIPIYQAFCIDTVPTSQCTKWHESDEVKGFEAQLDFIYGTISQFDRYRSFMEIEPWNPGSADIRTLLKDAGVVYFNSYQAMRYLEDIGTKIGVSLQPTVIKIRDNIDTLCQSNPYNAFYSLRLRTPFGDLGTDLPKVPVTGGSIVSCDLDSKYDNKEAPENREWHEFSHYFHYQMYQPRDGSEEAKNHAGYNNPTTNDSLIEGFAEFNSMLIKEYYGDPKPYLYKVADTLLHIELDYHVWGNSRIKDGRVEIKNPEYEEFAVAGILWDLHDNGDDDGIPNTKMSKVYPLSVDNLSLPADQILKIIRDKRVQNLLQLRTAFSDELGKKPVEMIFVNHGAFDDTMIRNFIHDRSDEFVGDTGSKSDPARMTRHSPKPLLPGSYIVTSNDATFKIDIILDEPYEYYNFSYEINMTANKPQYFEIPPPHYHSKAVFSQVSDGKTLVPEAIVIDSEEYWRYIDSEPEEDTVFKIIPSKDIVPPAESGISVAMKHKQKLTLVSVKNNGDEEIFGFQMKIDDGKIRYVKARGWDRDKIDQSTIVVYTSDKPIKPGKSLIFLMVVDNKASSFEWAVLDTTGNMMVKGDVRPR